VYLVVVLASPARRILWIRVQTILDGLLQGSCVRESCRQEQDVHDGLEKLHAGVMDHQHDPDVHNRSVEPYCHNDCEDHGLQGVQHQISRAVATSEAASRAL
jgi:hypothetical protein